jgi:hypothetical protein
MEDPHPDPLPEYRERGKEEGGGVAVQTKKPPDFGRGLAPLFNPFTESGI